MKTLRLSDGAEGLSAAAQILKNGGIVAIPTETVYGLAASALDTDAIERVFLAKGRPQDNPLTVHISDMEKLSFVARDIPDDAFALAEKFWPGPLTMVLPRNENIPKSVSAGLETVAVRMPSHPVAREIIERSGLPLAAPSANLSGSPSPTKASHVLSDLDGKIDAVVMSGRSAVGVESTVVSLVCNPPRLLRPGGVTVEQLREILPDLVIDSAVLSEADASRPVASPGMKYKHYSPKTRLVLVDADAEQFRDYVNQKSDCGAICFEEDSGITCPTAVYGSEQDDASQAGGVFSALRAADSMGVSTVYVHAPRKSGIGLAVYNRLVRAAAFKVVEL